MFDETVFFCLTFRRRPQVLLFVPPIVGCSEIQASPMWCKWVQHIREPKLVRAKKSGQIWGAWVEDAEKSHLAILIRSLTFGHVRSSYSYHC
jgi:hypothetical protein